MATNKVFCSYQEVIDMHTEQGHATAVGIHTPVGDTPRKMFSGFFDQFKKYKYLGCSISFVPVATLPADPSQIAVDGGEYSIDPRDLVNPIMFHGCHGDDMGTILNRLYGDNTEVSDALGLLDFDATDPVYGNANANLLARLYYKALTDNTWKKAHPQKGFRKKGLRPLVYSVATNRQLDGRAVGISDSPEGYPFINFGDPTSDIGEDSGQAYMEITKQNLQFFTPRLTGLGWMDTRNVLTSPVDVSLGPGDTALDKILSGVQKGLIDQISYAELPKIYMGMILLAPAFKTEMWFRVILNHHFAFKDFRGISFKPEVTGVPSYTNADDIYDPETYDDIPIADDGDEPEPTVPTVPVVFKLRPNSGSGGSNGNFVFLGYKLTGDSDYTYFYENRDHTGASTEVIVGPFDIPVGAEIGGTYARLSSGNWIMGDLSSRKLYDGSTITFDGDTYSLTSESNIGSEVPSGSAGLYVGWYSDVGRT